MKKPLNKKIGVIILFANVAKGFGIGDTVYVWFDKSNALEMLPQARVVADVRTLDSTNDAEVSFTTGEKILDGPSAAQRVFTTQALCATAIVSAAITRYTPAVLLDATTSGASTAAQPSTTLVRKS